MSTEWAVLLGFGILGLCVRWGCAAVAQALKGRRASEERLPLDARSQVVCFAIDASRTLIKFCEDHDGPSGHVQHLRDCLKALEDGDSGSANQHYEAVTLGLWRMGGFCDSWGPKVKFQNEDPVYLREVFRALLNDWVRLMELCRRSE